MLQRIRWGRIPRLRLAQGQPVVSGLRWTRTIKVLGKNVAHQALGSQDFALRPEVHTFFQMLAEMGDAEISNLEVRDGLPLSFEIHESSLN